MQIIRGGLADRKRLIDAACNEHAEFLTSILLTVDYLNFLVNGGQLTREQYDTLKKEVHDKCP
jgi:hypothetical protein